MRQGTKNILGVLAALFVVVAICVYPLLTNRDSEFGGADGAADDVIYSIATDYEPWAEPMWAPPGGETESLLFCLQAALGSGVFCFCAGYLVAVKRMKKKEEAHDSV